MRDGRRHARAGRVPAGAARNRAGRAALAALAVATVVGAGLAGPAAAREHRAGAAPGAVALAEPAPLPPTVRADPLPTTQVDGVVWTQLVVGPRVYVGGSFTTARPAGAAPGVDTVPRTHLLAYDLETGVLVPDFGPVLNGQVQDLALSPDGTTLYAAGQFTQVDGQNRYRVAAFDVATGALSTTFRPTVNATVASVAVSATSVVIGGVFSSVNGSPRSKLAALSPTGATQPLATSVEGGSVHALTMSPDGASVVVGGSFTSVHGSSDPGYGLARVSVPDGAPLPLPVNAVARNGGPRAAIVSLESDGERFYGSGYVTAATGGNVEGSFAADWTTGGLVWIEDCHGDTYSAFPVGGVVYQASHKHYCGNTGGFPQSSPGTYRRATATTREPTRTNTRDYLGYVDHRGRPGPTFLDWYPDIDAGTYTGKSQGPWSVAGTDRYVLFGGEFTRVGGLAQQGLVRFATADVAPNAVGPQLAGAAYPLVARSSAAGRVELTWRANTDPDDARLTYRVEREGAAAPVHETTLTTSWWDRHAMHARDTGLPAGSTQRYRVVAVDGDGNAAASDWVPVTVAASGAPSAYAETVLDDAPAAYWRMGETTGYGLVDATGTYDATATAGVARGVPGAIAGDPDRATRFTGSTTAASSLWGNAPGEFTVEAWVRTTTTAGGKIVGFGSLATGTSGQADRHLYMDDRGRLLFGVLSTGTTAVLSPGRYDDDAWHHVVGTYAAGTMRLYVDGAQVAERTGVSHTWNYWGRWRLGGDRLVGWPADPTSDDIAASVDEVAVYTRALPPERVAAHHTAGRTPPPPVANAAPSAAFTATTAGLVTQVDGTGSSDPDGAVAAWAWAFGDGATATGPTASHAYAAPGSYPVTLTVTDAAGATASTTRTVTVAAPAAGEVLAGDTFTRTVAGGWGDAERGGAWTTQGAAAQAGVDGASARHVVASGATLAASLGVAATDVDASVTVGVDRVPDAGAAFVHVQGRRVGPTAWYGARLRLAPDGSVQLHVTRGNGSPVAGVVAPDVAVAPGDRLRVRVEVVGTAPTTVRAKVWEVGAAEPAAWQTSASDATAALQAPGGVGLATWLGSATNGPLTVTYDDLAVSPPTAP